MKAIFILLVFGLTGCAQLMHGQKQPVVRLYTKDNLMYTTCSGAVEVWNDCYEKAANTCSKGYTVKDTRENPNGGKRELTFKCN